MNDEDFSDSDEIGTDVRDDKSEWEGTKWGVHEEISRKYRRETTGRPQPSAGFGKSRFGLRPDRIFPTRRGKPSGLRYRKDNEDLYRYDDRPYETIFLEGFRPWNNKVPRSLRHYMRHMQKSAFVSTTRVRQEHVMKLAFPSTLSNETANRYVIKAPGGIDLLETLKTQALPKEQEVMFWKGIRPEFIDRVEVVNKEGEILKVVRRDEWEKERAFQFGNGRRAWVDLAFMDGVIANAAEAAAALNVQAEKVRSKPTRRGSEGLHIQQSEPSPADMNIARLLVSGEDPEAVVDYLLHNLTERRPRAEEDLSVYEQLARWRVLWSRVGESGAVRLVLAEQRAQRFGSRDRLVAGDRLRD
ncbi:hypothetical protein ACFVFJ_50370, partial [Streptomyces sp. NPDC057717]